MVLYNGSGTASGNATASLAGSVVFHQSGNAAGSAEMTGSGGVLYLSTGRAYGTSQLLWAYIQEAGGTASGSSSVSGSGVRIRTGRAVAMGGASLQFTQPLPMLGLSFMSAAPAVDSTLRAITLGPKTFQWLQLLQRGDLSVFICEKSGGVVIPSVVVYSLYYVRSDGSRKLVGPQHKTPVSGEPGEFYAVGLAGESSQPGNWIIEWKIQKSSQYPLQIVEMPFRVLDSVLAQDPSDLTPRKAKFGWN